MTSKFVHSTKPGKVTIFVSDGPTLADLAKFRWWVNYTIGYDPF